MAESYPPRRVTHRKNVPEEHKATQVRVGSTGPHTHPHELFWKHVHTPKLCAHHSHTQPSPPGMQLGHARGCMSVYYPGKHRQGFGLETDLAAAQHPDVAQLGLDSCTGAGDPPEAPQIEAYGSFSSPSLGSAYAQAVFDGTGVPAPRPPLPSTCYQLNGRYGTRRTRRNRRHRVKARTSCSRKSQWSAIPRGASPIHHSPEPPASLGQLSQPRTGNKGTILG